MKNKNNKNNETGLSYYGLSLLSYLKESHPHLSTDIEFIRSRADDATEKYSEAIKEGLSHTVAEERANAVLVRGLLFSPHDMLCEVLWNEFSGIIPQSEAGVYAGRIYPETDQLFKQYPLSDEFAYSPGYNELYTELTGLISSWLEENEL